MAEDVLPAGKMLDRLLRQFMDPLLKPAGFARKGRKYRFESEHGDVLHVRFTDSRIFTVSNTSVRWWIASAAMAGFDGIPAAEQDHGTVGPYEMQLPVPTTDPGQATDFASILQQAAPLFPLFGPRRPHSYTGEWVSRTSHFSLPLNRGLEVFDECAAHAAAFVSAGLLHIAQQVRDQRKLVGWLYDQFPGSDYADTALSVLLDTAPVTEMRALLPHFDAYIASFAGTAVNTTQLAAFRTYAQRRLAERDAGLRAAPRIEALESVGVFRWSRGFAGSYLLARWAGELSELPAIDSRTQGLEAAGEFGDGWRVGAVHADDLAEDAAGILAEVAEQTGAPALLAYCFEGAAVLEGFSGLGGYWRGCLNREIMRNLAEEVGEDFERDFALVPEAVEHSAQWAQAAGWSPDREALVEVLSRDRPEGSSVEPLLWRYFTALGLT